MDSDSDSYITTYSEDERREAYFEEKRRQEVEEASRKDHQRHLSFQSRYRSRKSQLKIFDLPGLSFLTFNHKKIKLRFVPHQISKSKRMFVSRKLKFYCSLKYGHYGEWMIKRDYIPVPLKKHVYGAFFEKDDFAFYDENVDEAVMMIYQYLCKWTKDESEYRLCRKQKHEAGHKIQWPDSTDEELFLTEEEVRRIKRREKKINQRLRLPRDHPLYAIYKKHDPNFTVSEDSESYSSLTDSSPVSGSTITTTSSFPPTLTTSTSPKETTSFTPTSSSSRTNQHRSTSRFAPKSAAISQVPSKIRALGKTSTSSSSKTDQHRSTTRSTLRSAMIPSASSTERELSSVRTGKTIHTKEKLPTVPTYTTSRSSKETTSFTPTSSSSRTNQRSSTSILTLRSRIITSVSSKEGELSSSSVRTRKISYTMEKVAISSSTTEKDSVSNQDASGSNSRPVTSSGESSDFVRTRSSRRTEFTTLSKYYTERKRRMN